MNTQPEALRLAYWMDDMPSVIPGNDSNEWHKAAAELRRLHKEVEWMKHNMSNVSRVEQSLIAANERLHAVNTELLEALKDLEAGYERLKDVGYPVSDCQKKARAVIAKATGEQA